MSGIFLSPHIHRAWLCSATRAAVRARAAWGARAAVAAYLLLVSLAGLAAAGSPADSLDQTQTQVAEETAPSAELMVADMAGQAISLKDLAGGAPTLLFICDPAFTRCREGAVYFDSQSAKIEAAGVKPVCILLASAEAARSAAGRLDLAVPVYVDSERAIPPALLGQEILPAMLLLDGQGQVRSVALGGGESLDSNLSRMLKLKEHRWRLFSILIPLAVFAIILLVAE